MISFRKNILRIITLSLILLTISCGQIVDSNELFKNETFLKLNIYPTDSVLISNLSDLEIDSPKVKELGEWIDKNRTDWKKSIASFAQPSISIIGDSFRMLIFNDSVVVGFTDDKGNQKQYTKQTDFYDFEFLLRDK